jgi:DNA (cytosine-5)-methyltransferase 1
LRIIAAKRPKFFVAENVKGILSLAKGQVMEMILEDFKSIGFKVQKKVLNAADYGVPQLRERVFIVGVRDDVDCAYEYPDPTHSADGRDGLPKWIGIGEALSMLPDPDGPHDVHNHEYSKYKLRFNGYLGHRRIDPLRPAPTVTARGDDKGGVVVLHHPNNQRRMTCRELATAQSFPIDYVFSGARSSVYRQIANAVPPLLAFAVARQFNAYAQG